MKVKAKAKVTLIVEVGGSWESGCTLDQVKKQCLDGIELKIRKMFPNLEIGVSLKSKPEIYEITLEDIK